MRTHFASTAFVVLVAVSLVVPGCSSDSSDPSGYAPTSPASGNKQPDTPTNTVQMAGMVFSPVTLTVAAGTVVTWSNNDDVAHTSTSTSGIWDTGNIPAGGSKTTTFGVKGTYSYTCTYHASMGMRGTVVVQ